MANPKKVAKSIGNRLSRNLALRRRTLGLTQAQLAERVGVSTETVARFERATYSPSLSTLEDLAAALRCDPQELVADMTAPLTGSTTEDRILSCLSGLDHEELEHVLALVDRESAFLLKRRRRHAPIQTSKN